MAENIDREALLHDIEQSVVYTVREKITSAEMRGAHKVIERIKCAPTIDAVPVVRCKDCVHSYRIDGAKEEYDCRKLSYFSERLPPYHFCSYGEKMNGGAGK